MDVSSFLTSLGTSFVIFVVLMLLFTWLSRRPGNRLVYYPNPILKGLDPTEAFRVTRNPFAWIREAVSSTEQDVITHSGIDTAVYFVFLTTALGILVLSAIVLLPLLLPVAYTGRAIATANETTIEGSMAEADKLSMENIADMSPRLWAFVVATYWVSFVTYYLLWQAYKHVSDMRASALISTHVKNEQFAVLVRDIPAPPDGLTRREHVDSYFKAIYPHTYYSSMVVTDIRKANKIYQELEGYRRKLARAKAIQGKRPTARTGFAGLIGRKVDATDYYDEKIRELVPKLEAEQKATLRDKQQPAAVVFFNDRAAAAAAAQSLHDVTVDHWTVTDAPEPRQLLWPNLAMNFYARLIRRYLVYSLVLVGIFFYMIPVGMVSAMSTLENLKKLLPVLTPLLKQPAVGAIVGAYLPQLALMAFLAVLPSLLLFLSKAEGLPSLSHAERAASGKYFYFTVLNVFIGVAVGYSLFNAVEDIGSNPKSTVDILARGFPRSATLFLTFVALKFFVGYGVELSRIFPLIVFHMRRKFVGKTEAAVGNLKYGTRFPDDMLILTIVLCYSVMAPIILLFGVMYFALGWLVLRNQVLKVYVPSYESYGRMWPHMYNRVMAALILCQLTMLCYCSAKKFLYTPLLVLLLILSLLFAYFCTTKYYRFFQSTALDVACRELEEPPNMEEVFRSYVPPCLTSFDFDDDALSHVSVSASLL